MGEKQTYSTRLLGRGVSRILIGGGGHKGLCVCAHTCINCRGAFRALLLAMEALGDF